MEGQAGGLPKSCLDGQDHDLPPLGFLLLPSLRWKSTPLTRQLPTPFPTFLPAQVLVQSGSPCPPCIFTPLSRTLLLLAANGPGKVAILGLRFEKVGTRPPALCFLFVPLTLHLSQHAHRHLFLGSLPHSETGYQNRAQRWWQGPWKGRERCRCFAPGLAKQKYGLGKSPSPGLL